MKTRIGGLLLAIFFCLAGMASAEDFFFIQMSDPQLGMYTDNSDFAQETANFEFAVAAANRLKPAFVVVTGDLINQPANSPQSAEYLRIVKKLDPSIPVYSVAGNHDVGNTPTAQSLAAYREKFGRDYYAFRSGDFEGIVLNSSLIQHPDGAPEEAAKQEAWLKAELEKARRENITRLAVFQHISFFIADANEPDQYFNIPRATRMKYLDMLESYGVHDVFAGHFHRNAYGETPSLHMITTGPVGKPLGKDPSGFRVVHVRGAKIESEYVGFGNIPNLIKP